MKKKRTLGRKWERKHNKKKRNNQEANGNETGEERKGKTLKQEVTGEMISRQ